MHRDITRDEQLPKEIHPKEKEVEKFRPVPIAELPANVLKALLELVNDPWVIDDRGECLVFQNSYVDVSKFMMREMVTYGHVTHVGHKFVRKRFSDKETTEKDFTYRIKPVSVVMVKEWKNAVKND